MSLVFPFFGTHRIYRAVVKINVQNIVILAPEVTEENFEDLLGNDDVLLDYFNAFLCLPVSFFIIG